MYWGNFLINYESKNKGGTAVFSPFGYHLFLLGKEFMNKENIIISLVAFIILSIILYLWNMRKLYMLKKKHSKKKVEIVEFKYLNVLYGLKREKLENKKIILLISITNSFIISSVFFIISLLPWAIIWQLLLGFVLIIGLIYAFYGILGKILVMKGFDK